MKVLTLVGDTDIAIISLVSFFFNAKYRILYCGRQRLESYP